MREYVNAVYNSRYFWYYLAKKDIKFKFRRSKLGGLWMMVQPLAITMILAFVFSTIFNQPMGEYAEYVLSGIVVWNLITSAFNGGGSCLISSVAYIRQFNHPKTIYSLKAAIVFTYTFVIELLGLFIWLLITNPKNLLLGLCVYPVTLIICFIITWEITTIAAYINAKYYDYPQLIGLILQAVYFISPIFLKTEVFVNKAGLDMIYKLNPITHLLNLIREPFLYGRWPSAFDFGYMVLTICWVGLIAFFINKKNEKTVIYYL